MKGKYTMKKATHPKTFRLVLSALMIALGTVLSVITPIPMPLGGSVTPGAMVPLVIISQLYGTSWGLFTCTAYGLLQMLLGLDNFGYVTTIWAMLAVALFDYLMAYGAVGFSGLTHKIKSNGLAAGLGAAIGCTLRFIFHFVCGAIVWSQWADIAIVPTALHNSFLVEGDLFLWTYSFFYNLTYMLPEGIITVILSCLLVPIVKKFVKE